MPKSLLWSDLKYDMQPWIINAIDSMNFKTMTPVQASTIPMFVKNKDVVVESVTGSGKTIAFVIPILEKIVQENANTTIFKQGHFHSLIISPTRELASQIQTVVESFLNFYTEKEHHIRSQLLVGTNKSSIRDDINDFMDNRPQILIGTPGRILDFLKTPSVKTNSCSILVLDEADKLLDTNFEKDIETILRLLPKQRRTGLFSATISSAGSHIFKTGMRNPVKITVKSNTQTPTSLSINYIVVKPELKIQLLLKILTDYQYKKSIVYFPTCIAVTYFYSYISYLKSVGIIDKSICIYSLHGKLQTHSRMKTLETFTKAVCNTVLLTTDVAARGIDIPDVDLVLQIDPPTDVDVFLHRCGRTGRAGKVGKAIVFINEGREEDYVPFLGVKNIDLNEINIELTQLNNFQSMFQEWVLKDRARFDQSTKSYVAFIKYYSKHSASSIFRLQSLDYMGLAKMYGLLRLPSMPEITKYVVKSEIPKDGWLTKTPIDLDVFSYLDSHKEASRLEDLKNCKEIKNKRKLKSELDKKNIAWSNKTDTKKKKIERKEKMILKRKAIEASLVNDENNSESDIAEDWKDLVRKSKKKPPEVRGNFDGI